MSDYRPIPRDDNPHSLDIRFNRPPPAAWKRAALIVTVVVLFWFAFYLRFGQTQPKVIHASRYSEEFKYRPAASPVITEHLKDGRVRLRGAFPMH